MNKQQYQKEYTRKWRNENRQRAKEMQEKFLHEPKQCSVCKEIKPRTEFYKKQSEKDGFSPYCKICDRERSKKYIGERVKVIKASPLSYEGTKVCSKCEIEQPKSLFYKSSHHFDGLNPHCKECEIQSKYEITSLLEQLVSRARLRSRKLNLMFDIDKEYIKSLIPDLENPICPVLGIKMEWRKRGVKNQNQIDTALSLDRIKPELGYIKGNVAVISAKANRIKNDATVQDLEMITAWLKSVDNQPK